jgi:hypothetical protein
MFGFNISPFSYTISAPEIPGRPYIVSLYEHQEFF